MIICDDNHEPKQVNSYLRQGSLVLFCEVCLRLWIIPMKEITKETYPVGPPPGPGRGPFGRLLTRPGVHRDYDPWIEAIKQLRKDPEIYKKLNIPNEHLDKFSLG